MGVSKSYILIWIWNNEAERAVLYLRIVVFTPQVLAFAALTPPQQSFRGIYTAGISFRDIYTVRIGRPQLTVTPHPVSAHRALSRRIQ